MGTLLCDGTGIGISVVYAAAGFGVVLRVVVAEYPEKIGCGLALGGGKRGGQVVGVALGLVAAAAAAAGGWRTGAASQRQAAGDEEDGEGVTVLEGVGWEKGGLGPAVRDEKSAMILLSEMDSREGYPPPASRTTVLGALFTFAYHAAVVMTPAWLVSSIGEFGNNKPTLKFTTAAVWGGIVVSRCVLLPCFEGIGKAKHLVSWVFAFTASLLLLSWLSLDTTKGLMAVAALAGLLLGPIYPLVLGLVLHELDDYEKQSGVGVVVAFGSAGALAGACINLLVAFWGFPFVLYLLILGLLGGGLLCWNGLADGRER